MTAMIMVMVMIMAVSVCMAVVAVAVVVLMPPMGKVMLRVGKVVMRVLYRVPGHNEIPGGKPIWNPLKTL
ncbi:hypothetical protein [Cupriavidus plantarum]|uniref:hypothetical protein n=1 Tax=Cupriavidus plantarum TaxID=942865 RepID=UPI001FD0A1D7|nr:hypothetical protein [Cupriavidus plantarum]